MSNESEIEVKKNIYDYDISDEEIDDFLKTKVGSLHGYDRIGFSRPLGGYFYQFAVAIIGGVLIFATYGLILQYLYPYPTAKGYTDTAMVLFGYVQMILNVPTAFAIERFIGEYRIKNPNKMLEFMRFYIWYQMFTGLILVSTISYFVLFMLNTGNLLYAKWLMLILLTREYPACLDLFMQSLKGMQRFDFESKIYFFKDFVSKGFEVAFVFAGRYWGMLNPQIGEIMGLAMGFALGTYLDDFVNMLIAGHYYKKALNHMGFTIRDAVIPKISKDTAKQSIFFGFKVTWPSFFTGFIGTVSLIWWLDAMPAYTTLITLNKTADELANITKRSEGINLKAAISESYNNGALDLCRFYIAQTWKWWGFFTTGIAVVVFTFFPTLMFIIFSGGELETYLLAIPFILPNVIHTMIEVPDGIASNIILGTNHPMFQSVTAIIHSFGSFFFTFLWLKVLMLPQIYGIPAAIWLLPMGNFIMDFSIVLVRWIYIHKKIVSIKLPYWQGFVAPIGPAIISFAVGTLWNNTVHVWISSLGGIWEYLAGIITLLFGFIGCFIFLFISLYSWFGGWDDYGIEVFSEAVRISGPSRPIFGPIVKASKFLIPRSPFHNKYPIPHENAVKESVRLMIIRERNDEASKKAAS